MGFELAYRVALGTVQRLYKLVKSHTVFAQGIYIGLKLFCNTDGYRALLTYLVEAGAYAHEDHHKLLADLGIRPITVRDGDDPVKKRAKLGGVKDGLTVERIALGTCIYKLATKVHPYLYPGIILIGIVMMSMTGAKKVNVTLAGFTRHTVLTNRALAGHDVLYNEKAGLLSFDNVATVAIGGATHLNVKGRAFIRVKKRNSFLSHINILHINIYFMPCISYFIMIK